MDCISVRKPEMRAYEFMNEGLSVDDKHLTSDFLHTNADDDYYMNLYNTIIDMERTLDEKSEDYTIPADQIFSPSNIKNAIISLTFMYDELKVLYSWNRVLTTHCRRMLAYLQGQYLDW